MQSERVWRIAECRAGSLAGSSSSQLEAAGSGAVRKHTLSCLFDGSSDA